MVIWLTDRIFIFRATILAGMTEPLDGQSPFGIFGVVNNLVVNAFILPWSFIYVTRGLLIDICHDPN